MMIINGMTKKYGNNRGIMDFSLQCEKGEVISLIGPNGSGKSTSLKGIAGLIKLQKGSVSLDGKLTYLPETKKQIGYLPEELQFANNMTGYEILEMVNVLKYENFYGTEEEQIQKMMKDFDLWEHRHVKIKFYSVGMLKKIGIIVALLGFPKLIILDEPTNGVDTKGIITLKAYIKEAKEKGCISIVSSHILDFISTISTKNIFLKYGHVERIVQNSEDVNLEKVYKDLYL